jgi:hypothetical protein
MSSNRSSPTPSASPSAYITDLPPDTESEAPPSSSPPSSESELSDIDSDSYISDIYGDPLQSARYSRFEGGDSTSTVWNQEPVASYLSSSIKNDPEEERDNAGSSLGAFQSALAFLASERARLATKLEHSTPAATSYSISNGEDPRSKRENLKVAQKQKKKNRKARRERERVRANQIAMLDDNGAPTTAEVSSSYEDNDASPEERAHSLSRSRERGQNNTHNITPIFRQSARSARHQRQHFTEESLESLCQEGLDPSALNHVAVALRSHLLSLAERLSEQFPSDARVLNAMQFDLDRFNSSGGVLLGGAPQAQRDRSGFWDSTAGQENEKGKVHVFVDQYVTTESHLRDTCGLIVVHSSNILVGFLEWMKKQFTLQSHGSLVSIPGQTSTLPSVVPRKPKLSHASLILLLERGRKVGKRVLVASSPLQQSLDDMVEMGYEVSVLQRVAIKEGSGAVTPLGDGSKSRWTGSVRPVASERRDSLRSNGTSNGGNTFYGSGAVDGGSGGSSTESGAAKGNNFNSGSRRQTQGMGHRRYPSAPSAFTTGSPGSSSPANIGLSSMNSFLSSSTATLTGAATASRPRYREEAVDELLQLKLLQVLIATPAPPPRGSTIVLATGDGASSQFNREGFLGCVRQAVERGWRVELVGWEEGRSRAWGDLAADIRSRRRMQGGAGKGGLFMVSLEKWGWDLFDSRTSLWSISQACTHNIMFKFTLAIRIFFRSFRNAPSQFFSFRYVMYNITSPHSKQFDI